MDVQGLTPELTCEGCPFALIPHLQVPDGATVVLIPQLHNGGTVSQRLGQTGCPFGESESLGSDMPVYQEHQQCCSGTGLDSLEPQARPAEVLAMVSTSSGFLTPPCQWDSQISRLNQGVEIVDVRMSG